MKLNKNFVVPILIMILASAIGIGIAATMIQINNHGLIVGKGLATNKNSIDWGSLNPGQTTTQSINITNNGNAPEYITYSTTTLTNMTLSWNYNGSPLTPLIPTPIIFTLAINPTATPTPFSFNITISVV
jgi:hypothetical protein